MIPREFFNDFAADALPERPGLPFVRDELRNAALQPLVRPYDLPGRAEYRRRANRLVAGRRLLRAAALLAVAGVIFAGFAP